MHNDTYETIVQKLYIIGIYGKKETTPDFIPCLEKWFAGSPYANHVLGIERHTYEQKMCDNILDIEEVKMQIEAFVKDWQGEYVYAIHRNPQTKSQSRKFAIML